MLLTDLLSFSLEVALLIFEATIEFPEAVAHLLEDRATTRSVSLT
jgi:hypothetical protein